MTYIRASEIGCALDCDLATGLNKNKRGPATDDGPRINAAMAAATADNPITLVIDGSASISGLFLPAGGYWGIAGLGCGTGFFVRSGTNNDGIHNGPGTVIPNNPGQPAPPRGSNVTLRNFTLNGNQGNGRTGDSTSGEQQGGQNWYFGINLTSLNDITIENVVVVNVPSFHVRLSNVGNVSVSGCVFSSQGPSTDGLHFDGPANDIAISNCDFTTGDDSIALNCPEGYFGNISRVTVNACTFNSWSLMRLYTSAGNGPRFTIDSVSVTNCKGTLVEGAFLIGLNDDTLPNSVASLSVSDCELTAPTVLALAENFGTITLSNVTFHPFVSHTSWVRTNGIRIAAFARNSPLYGANHFVGSNLIFQNCRISRNGNDTVAAVILENGSLLANLEFSGFALHDPVLYFPVRDLLNLDEGSIDRLALNSLNPRYITIPIESEGFQKIGSVMGAGVLATGWRFPDAVMANGVPYVSEETGLPSIKIDGIVQPYQPPT
ncbi:MAG TPA: glycosyl hydrolase family 28 protein [Acidobacteriaceae bacterium]|jgi:hypothetical protein|nr:glycosyl hydrolase family 28 protein [Acidobacteriaceae bacterium]